MAPRFAVRQGDITTYDGNALVNAANNHLVLGAGVAGAIRRAGGPAIQAECDRLGPIRVGEAAITGAGRLGVRWVIHAAAMGDQPASERSIHASTAASVRLAAQHGARRIAFPILGSGIGGFDLRRAAAVMLEAIRTTPEAEALDEIVLYGFSAADAELLRELIE
ncbi:MAG TPA: macro domain-containing protein [Gemmatimonadales bacterium]|jgi:O-acetyl-ADP-ribose deacetylase (regulator of RNase III)|nr:macro domain-containing protein [Gemmatimonadales bacterium]